MRYLSLFLSVLSLVTAVSFAQAGLNFASLKNDMRVFERIVDERLKQGFVAPFATTDPKASYLQGYGVVVSYALNIRSKIRTPYGELEPPQGMLGSADREKNRIQELRRAREIMIQCLADHAVTIKQLSAHDRIAISAHVEDRNELDPVQRTTLLVVTTARDNVDLLAMKKITRDEFRRRLEILEY